jgi:gas vesicle protein GvpN
MSRESTHGRKVRGSQIRTDQSQKDSKDQSKEMGRLRKTEDARTESSEVAESFEPADQKFIETDAVKGVRDRVDRWLDAGRPVHLIGPTGCGKTSMAMQTAQERSRPVVWINGDEQLETSDLVGEYGEEERISERDQYIHNVVKSKDIVRDRWVDNPLTIAVREGATLVYNEFSRTKPVANNVLLSVFEEGVLELPGKRGESRYVDVHPEFRAILTSNSAEYAGVHKPQDALLDRMIGIYMDFYDAETEKEIVNRHVGDDLDSGEIDRLVEVLRELRDVLDVNVGTRAEIMAAEGLVSAGSYDEDLFSEICVDVLASKVSGKDEMDAVREATEGVIQREQEPAEE